MLVAPLVPGIDAGGIDSQLARDRPGRIDRKLARHLVEMPANRDQPPEVLDRELGAAVVRVESPLPGGQRRRGARRCRSRIDAWIRHRCLLALDVAEHITPPTR